MIEFKKDLLWVVLLTLVLFACVFTGVYLISSPSHSDKWRNTPYQIKTTSDPVVSLAVKAIEPTRERMNRIHEEVSPEVMERRPMENSNTLQAQVSELIAERDRLRAQLEVERTNRVLDEFRLFARAEGVDASSADIIADKLMPQLQEVPSKWELHELAGKPVELLKQIDASQSDYTGDPDQPGQAELGRRRQALYRDLNQELERILGFDRTEKVRWGPRRI